jgi:hypothetical protein
MLAEDIPALRSDINHFIEAGRYQLPRVRTIIP